MNKRPNILFLMSDQQQKLTVTPGSPCITPNLDRLCAEGIFFSRAYTCNAICSPARASLMTGLLPHNHGMVDCTHTVEDYRSDYKENRNTLSRQLKKEGYHTGYFGKWHIERTFDLKSYGFDEYETENEHKHHAPKNFIKKISITQPGYKDAILSAVCREKVEETNPYHVYSRGIDFIERAAQNQDEPWCLFVSTLAPHDPYIVPEEFYNLYDPKKIAKPASFHDTMMDKPGIYRRIKSVWKDLKWEDCQEAIACYYGFCTMLDAQVGRILDTLEKTGQEDNTIVVYTTDHGDFMGAHGLFCKGVPAFEEVYNIPFVVKWPQSGIRGVVNDTYINTYDFAPTLLEMAGCQPLENIDGSSVVPHIKGEKTEKRLAFAEFHGQRFFYTQRLLWKDNYKYVFNGFDNDEFYDLTRDPDEVFNLIEDINYKPIIEDMAKEMWRIVKSSGDFNLAQSGYPMFRFAPVGPDFE